MQEARWCIISDCLREKRIPFVSYPYNYMVRHFPNSKKQFIVVRSSAVQSARGYFIIEHVDTCMYMVVARASSLKRYLCGFGTIIKLTLHINLQNMVSRTADVVHHMNVFITAPHSLRACLWFYIIDAHPNYML